MTFAEALKLLLLVSIVLNVLALALRAKAADVFYLFRNWRLGLSAFVAMFVVVPLVAVLIAISFDLKPAVKIALVTLAFSPVPPILPKKQLKAGGEASYVTGLLIGAALVSLIVAPYGLDVAGSLFGVEAQATAASIGSILAIGIGAPLVVGLVGGQLLGDRASSISDAVGKFAGIMLLLCAAALIIGLAPAMWAVIGDGTVAALLAMIVAGLAAGYWLAGDAPDRKAALSIAAATRHPGVAIAVATASFPNEKLAPAAILLFVILNAIVGIFYLKSNFLRHRPA